MKVVYFATHLIPTLFVLFSSLTSLGQCSEFDIINLKKVAIVFGEKDYKYAGALTNPLNDAQDISDSLKKVGFTVYTYFNTDYKTMVAALNDWYTKIPKYEVALFYYSGHGAEVSGENYLFPIDANPKGPSDLYYMAYSANRVLSNMESNNSKFNIMILDACRNNPFTKSWVRDFNGGLASMTGKGSFIGFASSPGTTASDGDRRNGIYTEAILRNITIPNSTIDQIFTKVNSYVRARTAEAQVPYKNSSLSSDFCFSVRNQKPSENKIISTFIQSTGSILLSPNEEKLFVTDSQSNSLIIQDSRTLNIQNIISDNFHPFQITTRTGRNIYIIDTLLKKLVIIDSKTGTIKSTTSLKATPFSFVVTPDERKAYVSYARLSNAAIDIIDLLQSKIILNIPGISYPSGLIASSDGKYLYINSNEIRTKGNLTIVETRTNKIVKSIPEVANGQSIGILPNNKKIYAAAINSEGQNQINVIDAGSLKVLKSIPIEAFQFSFTSDSKYMFVLGNKEVSIIGTLDDIVLNRLPFVTQPQGVALSDDGRAFVCLPSEYRTVVFPINENLKPDVSVDPELTLKKFKEDLKKQTNSDARFKLDGLFAKANSVVYSVVDKLIKELGDPYQNIQTGIYYDYKASTYSNQLGIISKFDDNKSIWPVYKATFTENSLIITLKEKVSEETFKQPLVNIDWLKVEQFVRTFYIKRLEQLR